MIDILVIADAHTGSKVGICPPRVGFEDGGAYSADGPLHEILRNQLARGVAKWLEGSGEKWLICNGDLIDGNHHGTYQIWSNNEKDHADAALAYLSPLASRATRTFVIRGTPTHTGGTGRWEEYIAQELGAFPNRRMGTRSHYKLRLQAEDVRINLFHQGPRPSKRPWLRDNAIFWELKGMHFSNKTELADLYVWSHYHQYVSGHYEVPNTRRVVQGVITPALQVKTEFVHKIAGAEDLSDIGVLVINVSGNMFKVNPVLMQYEDTEIL